MIWGAGWWGGGGGRGLKKKKTSPFSGMAEIWGTFSGAKGLTIFHYGNDLGHIWGGGRGAKGLTIFHYGNDLGHICGELKNSPFFIMAVICGTFSGAEELTIFQYGNDLGNIFGGYTLFVRPASYVQKTYTHQHLVSHQVLNGTCGRCSV